MNELRLTALNLALAAADTSDGVLPLAQSFLDFLNGDTGTEPVAEVKPARKPRKAKDADPTPETSSTSSSANADAVSPEEQPTEAVPDAEPEPSGDDLVEATPPDVSEVNAAVLAACKPGGIGKTRVVELLGEFGSKGGVPGLPKEQYRAFLDALGEAK